ncbi:MAG: HAD-IIIA family hydrolase [Nitrospirae bacterium]|nr:HAD-IIIA family hydrolase [Nitrospirota bacterium]
MKRFSKKILEKARRVKFLLLDVDGVMTDGTIYLDADGRETKAFNIYDGSGIHLVRKAGVQVGIITGRQSVIVDYRAKELGITEVHQKILDKVKVYDEILRTYGLEDSEMAYVGDDIIDLPILKRVGLSVAVPNAHPEVRAQVDWVTQKAGGCGAIREVTDLLSAVRKPQQPSSKPQRALR